MLYDFNVRQDRRNTNCFKYDYMAEKFGYDDMLPLSVADMDFMTSPDIIKAVEEIAGKGIYGYTFLDPGYYECVADWVGNNYNWQINACQILFCPRIVQAVSVILQTLTGRGDKVGIFSPSYSPIYDAITKNGRTLVDLPLLYEDFYYRIDYELLEREMKQGLKLLMFINPHNPTGRVWNREELERLTGLCIRYGVILVSDEIHGDFVFGGSVYTPAASVSEEAAQFCITLQSPAKTFNLPGLHVSHIITANERWRNRLAEAIETCGLHEPNIFVVPAVKTALSEKTRVWRQELLAYLQKNINLVTETLQKDLPGLIPVRHEGTYLLWISYQDLGLTKQEVWDWMVSRCRIGIQMGENFKTGGDGFFRINIACPQEQLRTCLNRMIELK